jgi:zinc transport system ATP-binding protein
MTQELLSLEAISFRYRDDLPFVFQDISITIHESSFLGIIGPNGGGKSTMLKLMARELTPQKGRVRHYGDHLYLPQASTLNPLLPVSVQDFLSWGAPTPMSKSACLEKIESLLLLMNLQDHRWKDLRVLSGGQRQKALIAQLLMRSPQLLLLDEPGQGLDKKSLDDVMSFLQNLCTTLKVSVVVIDHNIPKLLEVSDKVLCLGRGIHWHQTGEIDLKAIEHIYQHDLGLSGLSS